MRRFHRKCSAALLLAAAMVLPVSAANAGPSVRTLAQDEARLSAIAYRMALANVAACRRPEMMTGLILHDLTQYSRAQRPEASRAFSMRSGFGVLQLVPGGAGMRSGLQIDDEILAIGNRSVEDSAAVASAAKSFHRMNRFTDQLQEQLQAGPATLLVRRRGQLHHVRLQGEPGCGGSLALTNSPGLNAWADGKHITLTTGISQFAGDYDEIAFVIGHEMAHNILGHAYSSRRNGFFGALASRSRSLELEADVYAVHLMRAAGYRPNAGVSFLQRTQRKLWWAFSLDHPSFGRRIEFVARAIAGFGSPDGHFANGIGAPPAIAARSAPGNPAGPDELTGRSNQGTRALFPVKS